MAEADTAPASATDNAEEKKRTATAWLDEIKQAEQDMSSWTERAKKIERKFLDERSEQKKQKRQYALLWANVSVLQPAVYAQAPEPAVSRRFSDKDPVGRNIAEVLERSLASIFDLSDIDTCVRGSRDNFLVVGRGTAWVRYVPTFRTEELPNEQGIPEPVETLADETLAYDFVHWSDFIHPKARRWEDLPWVGRRVYPDKQTLVQRFGQELADKVMSKHISKKPGEYAKSKPEDRPCVYEIWSKRDREVLWIAKDYAEETLDRRPPLYDLRGFFPCPRPAYATLPTDKLEPIPDYVYYQDQAEEINTLTARIGALEDSLKLVGFYPAGAEGETSGAIEKALSPNTQNEMIPVPGWAAFVQGGGSGSLIEWLPIEQVVLVLQSCIELRQKLIDDVFQITGISDIIRGSTDPRETKGAQSIKDKWGSIRIRDRQAEMARFCRDLTRISAEIVAEKFQPETIWRLAGLKFPTEQEKQAVQQQLQQMQMQARQMAQQQQMQGQPGQGQQQPPQMPEVPDEIKEMLDKPTQEQLIELMRDDKLRSYRIDVETDSTIVADEDAEKQSRQEFVTVMGGLMQQAIPVAQAAPEFIPILGESLLFLVRAYRTGRQLEDTIETAVEELKKKVENADEQQKPPDPKLLKINADQELGEKKLQFQAQEAAAKQQQEAKEFEAENKREWAELIADIVLEKQKLQAENARTMANGAA